MIVPWGSDAFGLRHKGRRSGLRRRRAMKRRGSALVLAIWVIAVLSIMVLSFSYEARQQAGINLYVQNRNRTIHLIDAGKTLAEIVLLDYKTNRVDPEKPFEDEAARIADMYREQQAIYAEALEKATGLAVAEKWLYLSAAGKAIRL